MGMKKNDKNIDFYLSLYERENPGKLRAKRSSNVVFIVCALIFGVALIIYAQRLTTNLSLEQEIAENVEYSTDPSNIEKYEAQLDLQEKIREIELYDQTSETYLQQLSESERFSREWVEFFNNQMAEAIGSENEIISMNFSQNQVSLSCVASSPDKPKVFAEHLTGLKDDEGSPRFAEVRYTGFSGQGNQYQFEIGITLWDQVEYEPATYDIEGDEADEE